MQYQVSKSWWFSELGRKPEPGEVIELPEETAERYMHNEPGLLKAVRHTAQAHPSDVRSESKPKGRKRLTR